MVTLRKTERVRRSAGLGEFFDYSWETNSLLCPPQPLPARGAGLEQGSAGGGAGAGAGRTVLPAARTAPGARLEQASAPGGTNANRHHFLPPGGWPPGRRFLVPSRRRPGGQPVGDQSSAARGGWRRGALPAPGDAPGAPPGSNRPSARLPPSEGSQRARSASPGRLCGGGPSSGAPAGPSAARGRAFGPVGYAGSARRHSSVRQSSPRHHWDAQTRQA
jgi:hypothetical protein